MKARKLIKNAVAELKASEAIDHWQKGRERIEAEDLLAFVMGGEEPEPDDRIGEGETRGVPGADRPGARPASRSPTSRDTRSSVA
jgi:hypothetical protein